MSLEAELSKGLRAKQFIESEIYKDAFHKVRQGILDTWAESPIRDTEGQHELRLMLKLMDDINSNIVSMINTGKMAEKQIEQESKAKELAKKALNGLSSMIGR